MVQELYKVIFTGLKEGKTYSEFAKELSELLITKPENIEGLTANPPVVVKDNIDLKTAVRYKQLIDSSGGLCEVEPSGTAENIESDENDAKVLRTCPNCGYSAVSADDPLITAFQGKGECPKCGAIQAKQQKTAVHEEKETENKEKINTVIDSDQNSGKSFPKPLIVLLLIAFFILIIHFLLPGSKPEEKIKPKVKPPEAGLISRKDKTPETNANIILPGQTRSARISAYLPYFHKSSYFSIDMEAKFFKENTWEEKGMQFDIHDYSIRQETINLPERERKSRSGSFWVPDVPYGEGYSINSSTSAFEEGKDLYFSHFPVKLAKMKDSELKKPSDDFSTQINQYTFYIIDIDLSISVPDTDEFKKTVPEPDGFEGNVQRRFSDGAFCIEIMCSMDIDSNLESMLGGLTFDNSGYRPTKFTSLKNRKACIDLRFKDKKDGVYIYQRSIDNWPEVYCEFSLK